MMKFSLVTAAILALAGCKTVPVSERVTDYGGGVELPELP